MRTLTDQFFIDQMGLITIFTLPQPSMDKTLNDLEI